MAVELQLRRAAGSRSCSGLSLLKDVRDPIVQVDELTGHTDVWMLCSAVIVLAMALQLLVALGLDTGPRDMLGDDLIGQRQLLQDAELLHTARPIAGEHRNRQLYHALRKTENRSIESRVTSI